MPPEIMHTTNKLRTAIGEMLLTWFLVYLL